MIEQKSMIASRGRLKFLCGNGVGWVEYKQMQKFGMAVMVMVLAVAV